MTNVFSSPAFLESLAVARFPGKRCTVETVRVEGRPFRLLVVNGRPVTSVPWLDFLEPLDEAATAADRALGYLPWCALETLSADAWNEGAGASPERMPSPFVDWTPYASYTAFDERGGSVRNAADQRRRLRRIEKALGPVRYTYHDTDASAFDRCIAWKRAQYRATEIGGDPLADPAAVRLFRELDTRGLLAVSTLRAGDVLLAVHIGAMWEGRLYWWLPAYDTEHAKLSPGRALLELLLEDSCARGHREFDFLLGDEPYKWSYATHTRVVGPLGTPPLALRARRLAERGIKRALKASPRLFDAARQLRQRLRST